MIKPIKGGKNPPPSIPKPNLGPNEPGLSGISNKMDKGVVFCVEPGRMSYKDILLLSKEVAEAIKDEPKKAFAPQVGGDTLTVMVDSNGKIKND